MTTEDTEGTELRITIKASSWTKMVRERDEARAKYATEATEHMLAVNKLCNERDEAREQRNRLHELHNQNAIRHNELLEFCVTLRKERDEARREVDRYREEKDLSPMSWDT